jgi:hypothetical protein
MEGKRLHVLLGVTGSVASVKYLELAVRIHAVAEVRLPCVLLTQTFHLHASTFAGSSGVDGICGIVLRRSRNVCPIMGDEIQCNSKVGGAY